MWQMVSCPLSGTPAKRGRSDFVAGARLMLQDSMSTESNNDKPDTVSASEDGELERLRQAARRHAVVMGIPPDAANRVVCPDASAAPPGAPAEARGAHPGVIEILMQPGNLAIRDTEEESLRRKTVPEQLHAIAKLDLYREFEIALREIWPGIERWLAAEDCLLGSIETVTIRDSGGRELQGQSLRPLSRERLQHMTAEPSFRRTCIYVSYYVRCVWRAHIRVWADQRDALGDRRTVAPHFQMAAGKQRLEEFIWSGVNTAVKLMINSLVLLYELYVARGGGSVVERDTWGRMAEANRSFVSLFAAVGLNDFVAFDAMVEESRDPDSEMFQEREGLRNWTRTGDGTRLYQPFYQARFFRLVNDQKGIPRLDLDPEKFTAEMRRVFGNDIMIRRCPALRVGVINQVYGWISKAVLSIAGSSLA